MRPDTSDAAPLLENLGATPAGHGSGEVLESIDPSTGASLGRIRAATRAEYDNRVDAALNRFIEWRSRPAPKRGELVRRLGELLREHKESLGELVSLETGKIRSEGLGEVQEMIDICDFAVGLSRQLHGLTIASERPSHRLLEQWHPLGAVGIVTAFNFPVAVWAWNAALAAVCGDVCVWKPSPLTPLCSVAVQALCDRVAKEHGAEGVFSVVPGGAEAGSWVADDPRLPLVSFTGSIAVGRRVATRIAARLGRSILELGGNNGIIVLEGADLDLAVRAITFGSVGTAGQRCTSTRRLFVQRGISGELFERLAAAFRSVRIGNPREKGVLMGPLITRAAVEKFRAAVAAAREQGGEVRYAGVSSRTARATSSSRRSSRRAGTTTFPSPGRRRSRPSSTSSRSPISTRRCARTTPCRRGSRARSSPTACARRSVSSPRRDRTAASPTSTRERAERRSAAPSAEKKTRAAGASRDPTRGRRTCGARPRR